MRAAAVKAHQDCPEGTIVTADQQTSGRGRLGRNWVSEPGQGLYLSLVLRPVCKPSQAPILTLLAGLGVREALEQITGIHCDIRWPNDILINEKKCCGILVEMENQLDHIQHVIVGIGINLNQLEFPPDLNPIATSLRIETDRTFSQESILPTLLNSLATYYALFLDNGKDVILDAFQQASSYVKGRRVIVQDKEENGKCMLRGVTAGLNSNGQLLLRDNCDRIIPVVAGSVRPDEGTIEDSAAGS